MMIDYGEATRDISNFSCFGNIKTNIEHIYILVFQAVRYRIIVKYPYIFSSCPKLPPRRPRRAKPVSATLMVQNYYFFIIFHFLLFYLLYSYPDLQQIF